MVKLQFFLANSIFTPIFKILVRTLSQIWEHCGLYPKAGKYSGSVPGVQWLEVTCCLPVLDRKTAHEDSKGPRTCPVGHLTNLVLNLTSLRLQQLTVSEAQERLYQFQRFYTYSITEHITLKEFTKGCI